MPLRPLRDAVGRWSPGGAAPPEPLQAIVAAWPGIVGADIAKNAQPREIAGRALVVVTRSSAWSQQLQLLSLPILRSLGEVPHLPPLETLRFRVGAIRGRGRSAGDAGRRGGRAAAAAATGPAPGPAADAAEALERVRRRMKALRRAAAASCARCGAPMEAGVSGDCAPCAHDAERERRVAVERLIAAAPWSNLADIREHCPDATPAEYEAIRRGLLARWWLVLERVKRVPAVRPTALERMVASSYLLLHSRLPPDRLTPAVVRNLLGAELEARLWPHAADKAPEGDSSK